MSKHTPGPWKVGQYLGSLSSFHVHMDVGDKGRGADIVEAVCGLDTAQRLANARLIAAAPDLLEAAKLGLRAAEGWVKDQLEGTSMFAAAMQELDPIRAAIAKAEAANG